jgi:hypothetical protein
MFDVIFSFMEAWSLFGMLLMGGVFLLIGGGMIGYELYWRMNAQKIKGRISSVRVVHAQQESIYQKTEEDTDEESKKSTGIGKNVVAGFFILMFVGLPLLFSGIGVYMGYKYFSLRHSGTYADAIVVRNEESYDSDNGTSYKAVLEFRDQNGQIWEVKDTISYGNSPSYKSGARIGVYYNIMDPEYFVIDDFWHHMGIAIAFLGFGSVFIGFFALMFFLGKRQDAQKLGDGKTAKKLSSIGEMYYPVFEYQSPNGERMEQVGSVGRNSLLGILPGKEVNLLMFPDIPEKVRRPFMFLLIFGSIFLLPGLFITYQAVTSFEGSPVTIVMLFLIIGVVGWRIRKAIYKVPNGAIKEAWKEFRKQRGAEKNPSNGPFSSIVSFSVKQKSNMVELSQSEISARVKKSAGQAKVTGYIMLLVAVGLSVGSYYAGLSMLEMTVNGQHAFGKVVDINSRSDSEGGYTYYAEVLFKDADGNKVRFEDSVGSSHPMQKRGDKVEVLYDPANSGDAIIDRGLMNWGLSGGLALGAFFLLLMGFSALKQALVHGGMRYQTRI